MTDRITALQWTDVDIQTHAVTPHGTYVIDPDLSRQGYAPRTLIGLDGRVMLRNSDEAACKAAAQIDYERLRNARAIAAQDGGGMSEDYTVTVQYDRPIGGMWHCGPNSGWVTVKHNRTHIMARAYHKHQRTAREIAMACVEIMVADCGVDECQFPESAP